MPQITCPACSATYDMPAGSIGPDGRKVLAQAFSDTQLQRVAREVLDRCDAADGLADGLVSDTALCRINPQRLVCPAGGDGCLSAEQARALSAMMAGPVNRDGGRLYVNWPWDPGLAAPGWRQWTLGTSTSGDSNARHVTLMSGALGFEFVTPPDPTLTVLNFDFERDPLLGGLLARHVEAFPAASVTRTRAGHFLQEEVPASLAGGSERLRDALCEHFVLVGLAQQLAF